MPFKKLHFYIIETLNRISINSPTQFQESSIPVIKSGINVFCIAPKNSGKTTTLIISTLHRLNCEAKGDAPRALILAENKSKVIELYNAFLEYTKYSSVRVYAGYEQLHIDIQKSEIYMGIDVLITTPKNLQKLYLTNGVPISELKICSIEDAEFLTIQSNFNALITITESIKKCQYVVYAKTLPPKVKRLKEYFMKHAQFIDIKKEP